MDIQIKIQSKNMILQLAEIIIKDWASKIKQQYLKFATGIPLPQFAVLIVDCTYKQLDEIRMGGKFDLIIVVERANMHPAHILALSQQLSIFGQQSVPFVPKYVAQMTIANCIAIIVMQYLFINSGSQSDVKKSSFNNKDTKIHRLDCVECVKYFGAFNVSAKANGMYSNRRGQNLLDGGAPFYSIYPTKKGFIAIGNLQPKFYQQMVNQMGLKAEDLHFCLQNQMNMQAWPTIRKIFSQKFMEKTASKWQTIMKGRDTCVTEIKQHIQLVERIIHPILIQPKL